MEPNSFQPMASSIKAMDAESARNICSGQVITSISSVVKELIENSVDAGATSIVLTTKENGLVSIEVSDDGCGIEPCNFELLGKKHCTSKLKSFTDFDSLSTMGFRGEALHSLCTLSHLTLVTRHVSQTVGCRLQFDNVGNIADRTECSRNVGTTVICESLFYNYPVRRKQLEFTIKREYNRALQILSAYCLISDKIRITAYNVDKTGKKVAVLSNGNASDIKDNFITIYGSKEFSKLCTITQVKPSADICQEYNLSDEDLKRPIFLSGFVSKCGSGQGRSNPDRQFFYINSRPVDLPKLTKAVNGVYRQFNRDQYPLVVLNIGTDSSFVDINLTPDKRSVLFVHDKLLLATVRASLQTTFENCASTYDRRSVLTQSQSPNVSKRVLSDFSVNEGSSKRSRFNPVDSITKYSTLTSMWSPQIRETITSSFDSKQTLTPEVRYEVVSKSTPVVTLHNDEKVPSTANKQNLMPEISYQSVSNVTPVVTSNDDEEMPSTSKCLNSVTSAKTANDHKHDVDKKISAQSFSSIKSKFEDSVDLIRLDQVAVQSDLDQVSDDAQTEVYNKAKSGDGVQIVIDDKGPKTAFHEVVVSASLQDVKTAVAHSKSVLKGNGSGNVLKFKAAIHDETTAIQELSREVSKDKFKQVKVIGQFNRGFIIAKLDSDIFVVDQHAADEKYNFEMIQQSVTKASQRLAIPQRLRLTMDQEVVLLENMDYIESLGFKLTVDDERSMGERMLITAVPIVGDIALDAGDLQELTVQLAGDESYESGWCRFHRLRANFASKACRKSTMVGHSLTSSQMSSIVSHLGQLDHPWNCPHGRPTMRHVFNLDDQVPT